MDLSFFLKRRKAAPSRAEPREPHFTASAKPAANSSEPPALAAPLTRAEVRNMSPRQMSAWAHEMYLAGALGWKEYQAAIPAELHPNYNRTVGALTGEMAAPDRPRDMVQEWEERLAFFRRHNAWDASEVRCTERIVTLLRRQADPGQWVAAE